MPVPLNPDQLIRYLANQSSPGEAREVERVLEGQAISSEVPSEIRAAIEEEAMWQRFESKLDLPAPRTQRGIPKRTGSHLLKYPLAIAATVMIAILSAIAWNRVAARNHHTNVTQVISTHRAQQLTGYPLPDGTVVTLAPESELRYADSGPRGERSVMLTGEAYFSVKHDASHPFVVRTAHAVIRDIGTAFVVRNYRDDAGTRVAVESGRVMLNDNRVARDTLELAPGEAGQVDTASSPRRIAGDSRMYFAWMNNALVFDQTPVSEAIAQLNRWYDVDIQLNDSTLLRQRLSISLGHPPVSDAIRAIAELTDTKVTQHGRSIVLVKRER